MTIDAGDRRYHDAKDIYPIYDVSMNQHNVYVDFDYVYKESLTLVQPYGKESLAKVNNFMAKTVQAHFIHSQMTGWVKKDGRSV